MNSKDIVKQIMADQGITNAKLASMMGSSPQATWDRLNTKRTKDLTVSVLHTMLRLLDYKVIIVPRTTRVPVDGYEVD